MDDTVSSSSSSASTTTFNPKTKRQKQMAMAKKAIRSLIIALLANLSLTFTIVVLFGSGRKYRALPNKPMWFPPLWLVHLATMGSAFLMGLSGWLVWAEGGFRGPSDALYVYISQVSLGITWHPLVLRIGAPDFGLGFCLVNFGTLVACHVMFKKVNPIAANLVKPCLAWAAFLSIVTLKLNFL
ncbi:hypothetical protein Ancab_030577 [Ancistrocladus abbreviatus]